MNKLKIKDFPDKEVIEIEGIKYTYILFKELGFLEIGKKFKIVKREDGRITLKRLE